MPTIRPDRQFDPNIKEHSHSRKDYSYHKTFNFGAPVFEPELLFLSKILDQGNTSHCTAYESVAVRASEKNNEYDPESYWQDECTFDGQPVTQNGTSPRTAMSVGVATGFTPLQAVQAHLRQDKASAYFTVTPNNGMDQFDSIRAAIKQNNSPVSAFILWYEDWDSVYDPAKSGNGIVPNSFVTEIGGHAVKIAGWKTINGVQYLVVQNSWGNGMGDNGLFYFSREMSNRVFGSQGWVYIWSDSTNVQIQRLGFFAALLQNLLNLIESLRNQPHANGAKPENVNNLDHPSPNFSKGRQGQTPLAIVIHVMAGTLAQTDSWFKDPFSYVSAHWGVGKDGTLHHYVHEQDMAWHAGQPNNPSWSLLKAGVNPNLYTIGIEHEGLPNDIWPDTQKNASAQLIADVAARWKIPLDRDHVIGHYQIDAVNRPNCPAADKSIIDTLIALAKTKVAQNQ